MINNAVARGGRWLELWSALNPLWILEIPRTARIRRYSDGSCNKARPYDCVSRINPMCVFKLWLLMVVLGAVRWIISMTALYIFSIIALKKCICINILIEKSIMYDSSDFRATPPASPLMWTRITSYISVCLHNLFRWRTTTHYAATGINGTRSPRINRYNYWRSQMNCTCGSHAVPRRKVCTLTELARFPTDLHRLPDEFCSLSLLCFASPKNPSRVSFATRNYRWLTKQLQTRLRLSKCIVLVIRLYIISNTAYLSFCDLIF